MSIIENLELTAKNDYCKTLKELTPAELHLCLGKAMMGEIADTWEKCQKKEASKRRAYYFSAEFLMGRMMYNNLYCMGILDTTKKLLKSKGYLFFKNRILKSDNIMDATRRLWYPL